MQRSSCLHAPWTASSGIETLDCVDGLLGIMLGPRLVRSAGTGSSTCMRDSTKGWPSDCMIVEVIEKNATRNSRLTGARTHHVLHYNSDLCTNFWEEYWRERSDTVVTR